MLCSCWAARSRVQEPQWHIHSALQLGAPCRLAGIQQRGKAPIPSSGLDGSLHSPREQALTLPGRRCQEITLPPCVSQGCTLRKVFQVI